MIKQKKLFPILIAGIILGSSFAFAQEEDNVGTATVALQQVLSTLKESVDKLSSDNDQLAARDNAVKAQVLQLEAQLKEVQAQGDLLNKSADVLRDKDPGRAQQIAQLEDENYNLDNRIQKSGGAIKLFQQSMEPAYEEYQKLLLKLKGISQEVTPPAAPVVQETPQEASVQKEKLKLMKMIEDSQGRQESLHQAIIDYQKNTPLLPGAAALAHQQLLNEQIKDMQAQIAAIPAEKKASYPGASNQWDDTQLRQLEAELKALEKNYAQLKDLMDQMTKKAQSVKISPSQHVEGDKLQGSINDLNHQAVGLRADLDELRSQMVDLDKRKSHLEVMIQGLQ